MNSTDKVSNTICNKRICRCIKISLDSSSSHLNRCRRNNIICNKIKQTIQQLVSLLPNSSHLVQKYKTKIIRLKMNLNRQGRQVVGKVASGVQQKNQMKKAVETEASPLSQYNFRIRISHSLSQEGKQIYLKTGHKRLQVATCQINMSPLTPCNSKSTISHPCLYIKNILLSHPCLYELPYNNFKFTNNGFK